MGIQGLLPFLASSTRDAHISEFENQYVAVDAYCWLHKGIYSCSYELAMKKPTKKYVTYCMRYIEMLRHFKVKPILVFDGRNLSSKSETEKKRREERDRKYKKGLELIRAGKTSEGQQLLGESVDVGHELVMNLMKECREINVDCIVAPFEADAQLSYLSLNKIVACVITEDSDLLVYGCEKVMFKMDKSGRGRLVEKENIFLSLGMESEDYTEDKFRHMCILSGCDYLPSLPSVGPATALKFIKLICDKDILEVLPKLPVYLKKTKITVTPEYIVGFKVADNTFKHQLVYDPFQRKQVPLKPVKNDDDIVGEKLSDEEAFQLAIGNIDPITMKMMGNFNPDKCTRGFDILWRTKSSTGCNRKEAIWNSNQTQNGKRQSEVALIRENLKKYCTSQAVKISNQGGHISSGVQKSGFVFESKTKTSVEGANLLKSRYFNSVKKTRKCLPKNEHEKGKRKDETYEEYLQRLYEEQVSEDENGSDNGEEGSSCENRSSNRKQNSSESFDLNGSPQRLPTQIDEFQRRKEVKREENAACHSLLDEISKVEESRICEEKITPSTSGENVKRRDSDICTQRIDSFLKELPSMQDLSLDSPTQLSCRGDNSRSTAEGVEDCEKINKSEIDISQRSTSPVFKVRSGGKSRIRNESIRLENLTDTTSTPTSLYFSSPLSGSSKNSDDSSFRKTPVTSKRSSIPSKNLFSKANKTACKNQSSTTLFQFGFKKENKDLVDAT